MGTGELAGGQRGIPSYSSSNLSQWEAHPLPHSPLSKGLPAPSLFPGLMHAQAAPYVPLGWQHGAYFVFVSELVGWWIPWAAKRQSGARCCSMAGRGSHAPSMWQSSQLTPAPVLCTQWNQHGPGWHCNSLTSCHYCHHHIVSTTSAPTHHHPISIRQSPFAVSAAPSSLDAETVCGRFPVFTWATAPSGIYHLLLAWTMMPCNSPSPATPFRPSLTAQGW